MVFKLCVVPSCNNSSENHPEKLFLSIPKNAERRKRWATAIGVNGIPLDTKYRICEDHFNLSVDSTNWLYYSMMGTANLILKSDVVPHKYITFSPKHDLGSQLNEARKRSCTDIHDEGASTSKKIRLSNHEVNEKENIPMLSEERYKLNRSETLKVKQSCKNVGIQTNIRKPCHSIKTNTEPIEMKTRGTLTVMPVASVKKIKFKSAKESSSETISQSTTTEYSLPSSSSTSEGEESEQVCSEVRRNSTIILIEKRSRFYLGLPKQVYCLVKLLTEWVDVNYVDVLITIKKIRQGDSHSRLSDDFGCSISNISTVFVKSVPKISGVLQNFIFWPEINVVKRILPIPFRYRYSNVNSIIDCFEVEIEKPSNPLRQSLTWSEYKKCNTLKFLISCTPNGFINFISGAYGGRISDKNIIKESEYLQYLPDNVHVMADRGFKEIDTFLSKKHCKLVRPPSVSNSKKSTREEVREAKRISALRIHIERVIRRIREFEMLHAHSVLNTNMLPLVNHIVIISCGLINLQEPLIK